MSLSPGRRLGNYEVLGPLGAGDMGEVYEARDLRLARILRLSADPPRDPIRLNLRLADLLRRLALPIEGS
jgi:hypothetical protein